jgi:hypothetical protein
MKNPAELPQEAEQRGRNREEAVRCRIGNDGNIWANNVKSKCGKNGEKIPIVTSGKTLLGVTSSCLEG